jgi:hypothetical protein
LVNVATPEDAVAVVVPISVPPEEIVAVTTADEFEVITFPEESTSATWG